MVGGDERAYNAAMAPVVMGSGREMLGRHVRSVAPGQPRMRRLRLVARGLADPKGGERSLSTHCEVAAMLAGRVGLEQPVVDALAHAYERWDGKGYPDRLEGDAIPLAVRIAGVARDADLATGLDEDPWEWMSERRGRAYDPAVVDAFERVGPDVLSELDGGDEWETALAREPEPVTTVAPDRLDAVLDRIRRLRRPQVALDPRPFPQRSPRSPRRRAATPDSTTPRATVCGGRGSFTTSAGSPSRTGSGTSPVRSRPRSGSRCGSTPTTPSGSSSGAVRSRPSSSRRRRTTNASTGPGTTARSLPSPCRASDRILAAADVYAALTARPAAPPRVRGRRGRPHARSRGRKQARRGRGRLRARRRRPAGGPVAAPVAGRPHRPGGGGAAPDRAGPVEPRGRRAPVHLAEDGRAPRREPVREDRRLVASRRRRLRDGAPAPRLTAQRRWGVHPMHDRAERSHTRRKPQVTHEIGGLAMPGNSASDDRPAAQR